MQHFRRLATAEFYAKGQADLKQEVEDLKERSRKRERSPRENDTAEKEYTKTKGGRSLAVEGRRVGRFKSQGEAQR